jgi:hypothetical protein
MILLHSSSGIESWHLAEIVKLSDGFSNPVSIYYIYFFALDNPLFKILALMLEAGSMVHPQVRSLLPTPQNPCG